MASRFETCCFAVSVPTWNFTVFVDCSLDSVFTLAFLFLVPRKNWSSSWTVLQGSSLLFAKGQSGSTSWVRVSPSSDGRGSPLISDDVLALMCVFSIPFFPLHSFLCCCSPSAAVAAVAGAAAAAVDAAVAAVAGAAAAAAVCPLCFYCSCRCCCCCSCCMSSLLLLLL